MRVPAYEKLGSWSRILLADDEPVVWFAYSVNRLVDPVLRHLLVRSIRPRRFPTVRVQGFLDGFRDQLVGNQHPRDEANLVA